jgi:hypothetical protein
MSAPHHTCSGHIIGQPSNSFIPRRRGSRNQSAILRLIWPVSHVSPVFPVPPVSHISSTLIQEDTLPSISQHTIGTPQPIQPVIQSIQEEGREQAQEEEQGGEQEQGGGEEQRGEQEQEQESQEEEDERISYEQKQDSQYEIVALSLQRISDVLDHMDQRDYNRSQMQPREPTRSSLKEPDTFSGEDPTQLREFIAQCAYHFSERPEAYASDTAKILYMLSYLQGDAQSWFQPDEIDDGTIPYWDGDYVAFISELRGNFGPTDPVGDAENRINHVRMKTNERIAKYMVRFNRLASQLTWGDSALRHQFYRGLPDRIKDEMAKVDYENTLMGVRNSAQKIDQRYWTRELEKRRDSEAEHSKPNTKSKARSMEPRTTPSSSTSKPKSSLYQTSDDSSSKPKPAYANKLGSDGKITQTEKDRRRKEGLCMYCGRKGHIAADCKKRPINTTAKASKTKSVNPTTPDSKESEK